MIFFPLKTFQTSLRSIFVSTPDGSSTRQLLHFGQFFRSGGFNQFDYENKRINRQKYGRVTPPPYNLTNIEVPLHLYYSNYDNLVVIESVLKLLPHLRSIKSKYSVPIDGLYKSNLDSSSQITK